MTNNDMTSKLVVAGVTDVFKRMRISVGGRGRADAVKIFNTEDEGEKNKKWFSNLFSGVRK